MINENLSGRNFRCKNNINVNLFSDSISTLGFKDNDYWLCAIENKHNKQFSRGFCILKGDG